MILKRELIAGLVQREQWENVDAVTLEGLSAVSKPPSPRARLSPKHHAPGIFLIPNALACTRRLHARWKQCAPTYDLQACTLIYSPTLSMCTLMKVARTVCSC